MTPYAVLSKLFHLKNEIIVLLYKVNKTIKYYFPADGDLFCYKCSVHHLANYRSANLCLQAVPFFPGPFILKMKLMRALVNKNNEGSHLIIFAVLQPILLAI